MNLKVVEKVPVLVAIGVTEDNHRMVPGLQAGVKESASYRRELFEDLKRRELRANAVVSGITDGVPDLLRVFKEEFPRSRVSCRWRVQLHVARNDPDKEPRKLKKTIADGVHSIFCASWRQKAPASFEEFKRRTKPTEILAFVCLKTEITRRSKPTGKVPDNLPFLKRLAENNFTQNN